MPQANPDSSTLSVEPAVRDVYAAADHLTDALAAPVYGIMPRQLDMLHRHLRVLRVELRRFADGLVGQGMPDTSDLSSIGDLDGRALVLREFGCSYEASAEFTTAMHEASSRLFEAGVKLREVHRQDVRNVHRTAQHVSAKVIELRAEVAQLRAQLAEGGAR